MKVFLGIVLTLTCVSANRNLDEFINDINTKQNLWTAGRNFHDASLSELTGLLGNKKLPNHMFKTIPVVEHQINEADIPKSFDARTKWPQCKSIREVRDQSSCGSCWAVSVSSVISDRICIHSNATLTPEISAKHLMTCEKNSNGCNGGYVWHAFKFWRDQGLVTGGDYGSKTGCQTYPFPPCEHHVEGSKPACPKEFYKTPECVSKCEDSSMEFDKQRYYGFSEYSVQSQAGIQAEILTNGPVTAQIDAFEDLFFYKSGVYVKTTNNFKGGHAIRVIGWGEENGTPYWLVMNSWNEDWGDKGVIKFRRGTNECGIEQAVITGLPK